jgi:hypothetical protein
MALDPNIFFQGAALKQANDQRLQSTIGSLMDKLQEQRKLEQDPERMLRRAVARTVAGEGTPEDEALIKFESILKGGETKYMPDEEGNVRAVTQPTLYDRLYGSGGPSTYQPQYPAMGEMSIPAMDSVDMSVPKMPADMSRPLTTADLSSDIFANGENGINLDRIAQARVENAARVNQPAMDLSPTNAYVATTPKGRVKAFETDEAIRQKAAELEIESQKKKESAAPKAQASLADFEAKVKNMNSVIDQAINDVGMLSAGYIGQKTKDVGGTPAANLAATLETIKADAAFTELQKMRDNSPTGGALGSTTEKELDLLASAQAAMSQIQSPERLKDALKKYKELRTQSLQRVKKAFEQQYGFTPTQEETNVINWEDLP